MSYEKFIVWFENLEFYKEYLSKLPEPLNNTVFLSLLTIILVGMGISMLISHIQTHNFHRRVKKKNRVLAEAKLDKDIKDVAEAKRQSESNELMNNYLKFMMMVQIKNMTSLKDMTFEQWRNEVRKSPEFMDVVTNTPSKEELEKRYWIVKLSEVAMYDNKEDFKQDRAETEKIASKTKEKCLKAEQKRIKEEQKRKATEKVETIYREEEHQKEEELAKQEELLRSIASMSLQDTYIEESISEEPDFDLPEILESDSEVGQELEEDTQGILSSIPKTEEDSNELTDEQQSDFSKLVAMMQSENKQKEQVEAYNKKKIEITRKNADVLDKRLQKALENVDGKIADKKGSFGDEIEDMHKEALAVMAAEEKGKKKGFFKKK